jgi:formylglycine-generating enzyme required for sulfatase activity
VYTGIRVKDWYDTQHVVDRRLREARGLLTEARRRNDEVEALRQRSFRAFDTGDWQTGEALFTNARTGEAAVDRVYAGATRESERALLIDAQRADANALLADILYERALIAERDRGFAQRDELLERLALHDRTGERRKNWVSDAHVHIDSWPQGARVSIAAYVQDADGVRRLEGSRELGVTPLFVAHRPGTYLLLIEAAGHAPLRYPVLLARAKRLEISLHLPTAEEIPDGFVHIPAGQFLSGSAEPDLQRTSFFRASPIHAAHTDAYFIARHETTYGDWIEFLRALPAEERKQRSPRAGGGLAGALELTELLGGRWQIEMQPTTERHVALEAEPIRYAGRARDTTQDWRRMPVGGVTWEDSVAYAAWLHESGRVPGARLCSEHEWERAARGADDRMFPAGDTLGPEHANFDQTYGRQPAAFGPNETCTHAEGESPFGLCDMAGNVWEWTRSSVSPEEHVLRGGSYYQGRSANTVFNREVSEPTIRDLVVGLRICASPPTALR